VRYVIVGNGVAAISALESLRRIDRGGSASSGLLAPAAEDQPADKVGRRHRVPGHPEGAVTIISEEPHPFYSRPLISYLLAGEVTEDRLWLRPADFYQRMGAETMFGRRVEGVEASERRLRLDDGSTVGYDRLLVACGGRPILPPIEGAATGGVFTFTTLDEAHRLDAYLRERNPRRATVLGAGLIGLKTAEALIARGLQVTLVELADRVLSATLDARGSDLIRQGLATMGAEVFTGATISAVESAAGRVRGVVLKDGSSFPADLVVLAVGVRPATEFLSGSSIACGRGIEVSERMETNVEGVFAAGDAVEGYDITTETSRVVATWVNAARQGRVAGANMAGAGQTFEGSLAMNAVEIAGVATISVGLTTPSAAADDGLEVLEDFDPDAGHYRKVVLKGSRIVGGVFVGDIDRSGIFTGLIRTGTDVTSFRDRLLSPDFGLVWLPKEYRKHVVTGPGIEV
jgi:NAD(P)H-nitrite reductase large subunit